MTIDSAQVAAIVSAIVAAFGVMASAIGLVWRAGEQKAQRIEEVWSGRLGDCQNENTWLKGQLTELTRTFASEAKEDRAIITQLRETFERMITPPARGSQ